MILLRKNIEFCIVDNWDRPVFKDDKGNFFCPVDQLVSIDEMTPAKIEEILESINDGKDYLYYKGRDKYGEPDYPVSYNSN